MLNELLEKLGLKFEDLKDEERKVYEQWSRVLTKPDTTIEDLKKLLPVELARARKEQNDYTNDTKKDLFYKAYIRLLENLTIMITAPSDQRENLKNQLRQQFKIDI
jgi:Mg2+ and Co2+ transporter CorA